MEGNLSTVAIEQIASVMVCFLCLDGMCCASGRAAILKVGSKAECPTFDFATSSGFTDMVSGVRSNHAGRHWVDS